MWVDIKGNLINLNNVNYFFADKVFRGEAKYYINFIFFDGKDLNVYFYDEAETSEAYLKLRKLLLTKI